MVKVTVKNAYKASEKVPTFNWIKQKDKSDFYEVYGDTYISNILEGGEFMGIVSFKAHSSSEVMNIKAKLEGGFSGIQAKGAGAYDTSELQKMANTDVNVIYSGAGGVNSSQCLQRCSISPKTFAKVSRGGEMDNEAHVQSSFKISRASGSRQRACSCHYKELHQLTFVYQVGELQTVSNATECSTG